MKFLSIPTLLLGLSSPLLSSAVPRQSELLRMPADSEHVGGSETYRRFAQRAASFRDHAKKHLAEEYSKLQTQTGSEASAATEKIRGTLLDLDTYAATVTHDAAAKLHSLAKLGAASAPSGPGPEGAMDSYSGDPISEDDDDPSLTNYEHDSWSDFFPSDPSFLPSSAFDVPTHTSALKELLPKSFTWRSHPTLGNGEAFAAMRARVGWYFPSSRLSVVQDVLPCRETVPISNPTV